MRTLLAILFFMTAQAFAGVMLDFRTDAISNSKYSDGLASDIRAQSYFSITRARMKFHGKFNETLSYDTRLDFLNSSDAKGDDGASKFLNYAQLSSLLSESSTLTFGKLSDLGISGWEGQTSTGDMYFTSMAFYQPYLVGGRFDAILGSHTFTFYLVDGGEGGASTSPIASDKTQSRLGSGLTYKGNFDEKTFNFIFSYHILPTPAAASSPFADQNNYYGSIGFQYKTDYLNLMYDIINNIYTGQGTLAGSDANKSSTQLTVKYSLGNWIPTLKLDASTIKNVAAVANGYYETNNSSISGSSPTKLYSITMPTSTAYTNVVNQVAFGTEYKPNKDESFRYHVMAILKATTFDSSLSPVNKTVNESKVVAGVRILADVLK